MSLSAFEKQLTQPSTYLKHYKVNISSKDWNLKEIKLLTK